MKEFSFSEIPISLFPLGIFFVGAQDSFARDFGVDLSCGNLGVAKHFLDGAKFGSVIKQVGSKAMSQGVWRDVSFDANLFCITFDAIEEIDSAEGFSFFIKKDKRTADSRILLARSLDIILKITQGKRRDRNGTLLIAFAIDSYDAI